MIRYVTDDDKSFDSFEAAQDHDVTLQAVKAQSAAIQAFLTETAAKDESQTSRTRRENVVAAYVAWSARQEAGDRVVRAIVG